MIGGAPPAPTPAPPSVPPAGREVLTGGPIPPLDNSRLGVDAVAAVQFWSLDIQTETVKGWGMGEAWTTSETLMQSWSGNVECYLDPEDDGQAALIPGAIVTIEFYPHSTAVGATYYTGQGVGIGRDPARGRLHRDRARRLRGRMVRARGR